MKNINTDIIYCVLKAQQMSDLAKDRKDKSFYSLKMHYLDKAMELLSSNKNDIRYKVEKAPDQNGYPSNIYYFHFSLNGNKYEFVFHCPKGTREPEGDQSLKWNGIIGFCKKEYDEIMSLNLFEGFDEEK